MKTQLKTINLFSVAVLAVAALALSACNDDDDDDDGNSYAMSVAEQLANQKADSEPGKLNDPAMVKAGIESLFGDPDSEPVDIDTGESIRSAFTKAGS